MGRDQAESTKGETYMYETGKIHVLPHTCIAAPNEDLSTRQHGM